MPSMRPNPTRAAPGWLLVATCLLAGACTERDNSHLGTVKRAGELVVLTRNSPTTYYEGPDGSTGFEYDLALAFAERLGVALHMQSIERFGDILPIIENHKADFAAAGLTITPLRAERVRFTPSYQTIRQQVVHNARTIAPKNVKELAGRHLEVIAATSYVERLEQLKLKHPALTWTVVDNMETEELLLQVQEGLTDLTVADSNIVALSRQFNPGLRVAFDLGDPEQLAWAFPPDGDDSLLQEAARFIEEMQASGKLQHLIERHYGPASRFNPVNTAAYIEKIGTELPRFKTLFEEAGRRYLLDWRLLAAMSYQESYWNPGAISPTGVRGIMMLTEPTARQLGISNLLDPRQSIFGGAAYLRTLIDRIPARIPEPDRSWMALAAYNVGINHLEDARVITQTQGGDPDKWNDVKDRLPLLAKATWYTRARHGYARGYEPVQFVTRIRAYHDILRKSDDETRSRNSTDALRLRAPAL